MNQAIISPCGQYRYTLTREWDERNVTRALFIMLNPSTADADKDDPTIRKCIGFGMRMGFGGLTVVNLYAYRATDPKNLWHAPHPIGPDNDQHIASCLPSHKHKTVICAWGANARKAPSRAATVLRLIRSCGRTPHALNLLPDGVPQHPLMLSYGHQDGPRMLVQL